MRNILNRLGYVIVMLHLSATARSDTDFSVQIDKTTGFTTVDQTKLSSAAQLMQIVFRGDKFRDRVMAFKFIDDHDWTNAQIYEALQSGRESYSSTNDKIANFDLALFSPPF